MKKSTINNIANVITNNIAKTSMSDIKRAVAYSLIGSGTAIAADYLISNKDEFRKTNVERAVIRKNRAERRLDSAMDCLKAEAEKHVYNRHIVVTGYLCNSLYSPESGLKITSYDSFEFDNSDKAIIHWIDWLTDQLVRMGYNGDVIIATYNHGTAIAHIEWAGKCSNRDEVLEKLHLHEEKEDEFQDAVKQDLEDISSDPESDIPEDMVKEDMNGFARSRMEKVLDNFNRVYDNSVVPTAEYRKRIEGIFSQVSSSSKIVFGDLNKQIEKATDLSLDIVVEYEVALALATGKPNLSDTDKEKLHNMLRNEIADWELDEFDDVKDDSDEEPDDADLIQSMRTMNAQEWLEFMNYVMHNMNAANETPLI
jgi:hypothetical protein